MWTTAKIRRYVMVLPDGATFTTRDVLTCGKRAAIDQALSRLVKAGDLLRLARGVFAKVSPGVALQFTPLQIATLKAGSFAKKICSHPADVAYKLGLIPKGNSETCFAINGRSSSFKFGELRIHFKQASQRKLILADRPAGLAIKVMSFLGRSACSRQAIHKACYDLGRTDRFELLERASFMPSWLNSLLKW
jgi:hypothetical protein